VSRVTAVNLAPCGTPAAAQRHRRRGEPTCQACLRAWREDTAQRRYGTTGGALSPDHREIRNGIPWRPYIYRGTGVDAFTGEAT
jgi:hypothetical protein